MQNGDIWQLGRHFLMCADSTDKRNIDKLLNGAKVEMVMTDPPYDMGMGNSGCFSLKNVNNRIKNMIDFNPKTIEFIREMPIQSYYIFTSKALVPKYLKMFDNHLFNILVWCKTNPAPLTSSSFMPDIEYLLYFAKKGRIWRKSLKPTSVYKKYYISDKLEGRKDSGDLHPCMKPIQLLRDKIRISSLQCGNVLDLFGGAGATLIACEDENRNCYILEYDPIYCQTIIDRWERKTGEKAELIRRVA